MKTPPTEKNKQKTQTKTAKRKEKREGFISYTFGADSSCGLYAMGEEFWENLGEKITRFPEKSQTS